MLQGRMTTIEMTIHFLGLFAQEQPATQRIESMYACLKAIRAWYDGFFALPLTDLPSLTFSAYVELSQVCGALYRLTTSEDPIFNKDMIRNTADLLDVLDRVADRLLSVTKVYPIEADDQSDTVWVQKSKIMRTLKSN